MSQANEDGSTGLARPVPTVSIDVVTIFPELFPGALSAGLVAKSIAAGRAAVRYINPRDFATDKHQKTDDEPYGGGAGLVMKVEPLAQAIKAARSRGDGPVVLLTPQGRRLAQTDLARWAAGTHLVLVAGRYEGFDERVRDRIDEEISIGDFVLTGGEIPALAIIDGVIRLLPGTLHTPMSIAHDSFQAGLLEHPQYTRPAIYEGAAVPEILSSGHHAEVAAWRHQQSVLRTFEQRPDLWLQTGGTPEDWALLRQRGAGRLEAWLEVTASPAPESLAALERIRSMLGLERVRLLGPGLSALALGAISGAESFDALALGASLPREPQIVTSFSPPPGPATWVRRGWLVFA